ncbi:MAG: DUF952 domain-containing protein [Cyanobacteria bacterium P01_D01_bin.105]
MVFHITEQTAWERAKAAGLYLAPSLETEGFIHFSTESQVVASANRFYKGKSGLVLLTVNPTLLSSDLRYEDTLGHGQFPHLYGPLNLDAVVEVRALTPNPDGSFSMPD